MPHPILAQGEEKKRTALYLDRSLYEYIESLAEEKNVSANRAAIYLLSLGIEALEELES